MSYYGDPNRPIVSEFEELVLHKNGEKTATDIYDEMKELEKQFAEVQQEAEVILEWENKGLEELDDLEDSLDEEFLEFLKNKKLDEIQQQLSKDKYGSVKLISADQYKEEISTPETVVICHLHFDFIPFSKQIKALFRKLAEKFKYVKFIEIKASDAIPNIRDRDVPMVLVYNDGKMLKQFVGQAALGGANVTANDLEWTFAELGIIKTDLSEDPRGGVKDTRFRGRAFYFE